MCHTSAENKSIVMPDPILRPEGAPTDHTDSTRHSHIGWMPRGERPHERLSDVCANVRVAEADPRPLSVACE
jgi:hypothetical protein